MATSRKRPSSGFNSKSLEEPKEEVIDEELSIQQEDDSIQELLEEAVEGTQPATVFIEETIVPTEDPGPRFVISEVSTPLIVTPEAPKKIKRRPRNIPRFSRLAK